jgi:hypothetical protein
LGKYEKRGGILSQIKGLSHPQDSQIIQPWQFGHTENKKTALWLKGLPLLKETNNVKALMKDMPKRETDKVHYMSPGKDRGKNRSVFFSGIGEAMENQWGSL